MCVGFGKILDVKGATPYTNSIKKYDRLEWSMRPRFDIIWDVRAGALHQ